MVFRATSKVVLKVFRAIQEPMSHFLLSFEHLTDQTLKPHSLHIHIKCELIHVTVPLSHYLCHYLNLNLNENTP